MKSNQHRSLLSTLTVDQLLLCCYYQTLIFIKIIKVGQFSVLHSKFNNKLYPNICCNVKNVIHLFIKVKPIITKKNTGSINHCKLLYMDFGNVHAFKVTFTTIINKLCAIKFGIKYVLCFD